jgi:hypothetical protein
VNASEPIVDAPSGDGEALIGRLTRLGLADWPAPVRLADRDVAALCSTAPHEGVVCLLGAAIELGLVEVDAVSLDRVVTEWTELMARAVQLDELLLVATAALAGAGIPSRVLKGSAVASLDELDPAWRSYGDVDLLVPDDQLLAATDALVASGLRVAVDPVGRRWASRHAKSVTLVHESGAQVDLHRMLAAGPFGARVRAGCLFEQGRRFQVADRELVALSDVHRFLHACYHAALGGVRGARHRRDVLLLARSVPPAALVAQAGDGWSPAVVSEALRWAGDELGGVPDGWTAWLATVRVDAADRELLRVYGGSFRDIALAELRETRGLAAKVDFAAALVWPSRANLLARGRRRWTHLRRLTDRGRRSRSARERP